MLCIELLVLLAPLVIQNLHKCQIEIESVRVALTT